MPQFGSANSKVKEKDGQLQVPALKLNDLGTAPASAADTGIKGSIVVDATHIYVCTATDTWVRVAIVTW